MAIFLMAIALLYGAYNSIIILGIIIAVVSFLPVILGIEIIEGIFGDYISVLIAVLYFFSYPYIVVYSTVFICGLK